MSNDQSQSMNVRHFVDGELAGAELEAFETQLLDDSTLQNQVALERKLRQHVASVLSHPRSAPEGLKERIQAALAEAESLAPETGTAGDEELEPATVVAEPGRLRFPTGSNMLAVAASIALVVGAILVGIFGNPIDTITAPAPSGLIAVAADHMSAEHARLARDRGAREQKATLRDQQAIMQDCRDFLGRTIPRLSLESLGYTLLGSGHCEVPGDKCSIQLIFERHTPQGVDATASIFITPNKGQFSSTFAKSMPSEMWAKCGGTDNYHEVRGTTDGDMIYFVVGGDEHDLPAIARIVMAAISTER